MQRRLFQVVAVTGLLWMTFGATALDAADADTADALFRAEKWSDARAAYEELVPTLEGDERAAAIIRLGYCWQRLHKHAEAIPVIRRVFELDGISNEQLCLARLRLGTSLRMTQQSEEAVRVLDEAWAMQNVPSNLIAETLLNSAWELGSRGKQDEALERFRKIEHIEDVHQNYVASSFLNIGRIQQDRKQYNEAIATFRRIEQLNPVAAVNRARARVYRLECEALLAGDQPFHIRPFVIKVTHNSAVLQWVSQGRGPRGSVRVFTELDESKSRKQVLALTGEAAIEVTPLSGTICHLHAATLEGLRPHTRYRYEVQVGDKTADGSFLSAPEGDEEFSFSLIGDTQSYHAGLQPLLDAMGDENSDFVLHVGDVTDRGELWGEWKASFFDPGLRYFSRGAFWPAYGNHDGGPYFPALFGLRPNLYYSFDWGDAHFVVLDSYGAGTGTVGRPNQLKWLEEDLKRNRKKWTFAAMHVPMIATRSGLKSFGTDDFLPLLEEHGVDIVFSGHHPLYRRYYPLGSRGRKPILHITSGGGGGPVGGYMPSPLLATGINVNHYCRIDVAGDRLTLSAKTATGTVIDRFELVKSDGEFQHDVTSATVDTGKALNIVSLYQELLTDRTYELRLTAPQTPQAGKAVTLVLDLKRLPRGPLDTSRLPKGARLVFSAAEDSEWKIETTSASLESPRIELQAVAPQELSIANGHARQPARVRIQLQYDDRDFEPFDATARIQVVE